MSSLADVCVKRQFLIGVPFQQKVDRYVLIVTEELIFSLDDVSLGSLHSAEDLKKKFTLDPLKTRGAFGVPLVNYELPLRNVLMRFASFLENLSLSFTIFKRWFCFQCSRKTVSEQFDLDVYICIEKL